jgi:RecA-family ATPase
MSSRSGTSGSTAWNNSVRSRLYLDKMRLYLDKIKNKDDEEIDADVRVLSVKKSNYGPSDMEMRLRWKRGAFILYDGPAGGFDKLAAEAKADRVFLDLLDRYARQDRDVSPNHSNIYAPAMFEKHPNSEGITKKAFTAAMERLLAAEKILVEPTGPPSRRKQRLIVAPPRAEP